MEVRQDRKCGATLGSCLEGVGCPITSDMGPSINSSLLSSFQLPVRKLSCGPECYEKLNFVQSSRNGTNIDAGYSGGRLLQGEPRCFSDCPQSSSKAAGRMI